MYRNFREIIAIGFLTDLDASIKNERMKSSCLNVNRRQRGEKERERERGRERGREGESEKERERERNSLNIDASVKFCNFTSLHVSRPCVSTDSLFRGWKKHKKRETSEKRGKRGETKKWTYACTHVQVQNTHRGYAVERKRDSKVEMSEKEGKTANESQMSRSFFDDARRGEEDDSSPGG